MEIRQGADRPALLAGPPCKNLFCLQNCLNSSWRFFNKVLETFLRVVGPDWTVGIAQISRLLISDVNPPCPKGHWSTGKPFLMFHKPVGDDVSFATRCIILLDYLSPVEADMIWGFFFTPSCFVRSRRKDLATGSELLQPCRPFWGSSWSGLPTLVQGDNRKGRQEQGSLMHVRLKGSGPTNTLHSWKCWTSFCWLWKKGENALDMV